MVPFSYQRVATIGEAVERTTSQGVSVLAGGTNLIDLARDYVRTPVELVDITRVPDLAAITPRDDGGLRIGALASNTAVADHPVVAQRYAAMSEAILAGASQQIRNRASAAGNILQSVRCPYYWQTDYACNRREAGTGCSAIGHPTAYHGVLGVNENCIAAYPSDMAAGLAIYDPTIEVEGPGGRRRIPYSDFHLRPGEDPSNDTALEDGDVVVAIDLPPAPEGRSGYVKVRERHSYAYALVSVAGHRTPDGTVRLAFGSVGSVPWRAAKAEAAMAGGASVRDAIATEFEDAYEAEALAFKQSMTAGAVETLLARLEA